ncbi:hypothetical protein KY290_028722 [Solanum tuberosum]|uniref:Trafficking protein particle complex subunit 2 n=3 Tax=Solanum TaxID=4107 RepID=A0ABQ7UIP9_SOLTU|nr:hypothetical protein KY289_027924 [Solanum tuberosum]KAH0662788.1 hypothetical protein KY284_027719 [Solanum tuberosum]KAH0668101.1 hypothetical protein KY285_029307 [Solanum tuberosum]KAH0749490.1 hypothetical protein KY290_028722 [Solanum tuberosum]
MITGPTFTTAEFLLRPSFTALCLLCELLRPVSSANSSRSLLVIELNLGIRKMASTACFMIVSRNDIPIYEAEVGTAPKKEDAAHQHQFILHAALDIVQDLAWTTSAMFLKSIDRFNDLVVSVYVTAGHILNML